MTLNHLRAAWIASLILFLATAGLHAAPVLNSVSASTTQVGRYEKLELTVGLTAAFTNAYDPDEVDLWAQFTAPTTNSFWHKSPPPKVWRVNGFFDGTQWKIRFAPNQSGLWTNVVQAREASGVGRSTAGRFTCVASTNHGWVRIAPNHRYLARDDGTSYYGVGACYPWGNTTNGFDRMQSLGFNTYVYWNGTYDRDGGNHLISSLESGVSRYDQGKCQRIDDLIAESEARGLGMILVIWPHDYLCENLGGWPARWSQNPYHTITTSGAFYGDTNAWAWQEKMYRYIIARWSYSPALAGWQTIDEISGTSGWQADRAAANAWAAKIAEFFQTNDPFTHPTTASHGDFWDVGNWANNLSNTEIYGNYSVTNITATAQKLWNHYEQPCLMGEMGLDRNPRLTHRKIWAGLASGLAVTPLLWSFNQGWTTNVSAQYPAFNQFIAGVDFARLTSLAQAEVEVPDAQVYAIKSDQLTFGWITSNFTGQNLKVSGLRNGAYRLEWWDCTTGSVFSTILATVTDGALSAAIAPTPQEDLAFKLIPLK